MDVDIERLEAILSPYITIIKDSRIEYVSDGLSRKLGISTEQIKKEIQAKPELFTNHSSGPTILSLESTNSGQNTFACITIPVEDSMVIALSEEQPNLKPIMEIADRDTFVRMFTKASVGSLILDEGIVVYINEYLSSLLGLNREQVLGRKVIELISKENRPDFINICSSWYDPENLDDEPKEIMLTSVSGFRLYFMVRGGWIKRGSRDMIWLILHDQTHYKNIDHKLKEGEQNICELFDRSPAGMLYISPRGEIIACNDYVETLLGYTKEQINGNMFTKFVSNGQEDVLRNDFRELFMERREIIKHECIINSSGDEPVHIEYNAKVIYRKGHPIKALMVFSDVTDKKNLEMELLEKNSEMERTLWDMAEVKDALEARAGELNKATEELKLLNEKLNQLSITDGLTEVFNHRHFQDRLTEEVERLSRSKDGVLSLLIMDIDDFKRFNDTYGHQCGDMVLKQLAVLVKGSIRNIDILARYGGEEFAVILPSATTEQAVVVAERICETIRSTPFSFGSTATVKVTLSIGVGTIISTQADKSELVRKADSAMYAAKAKWKDRVEVWEED